MSPLSGGLAEVDHKLRSLQRRLNEFTMLQALSLGLSALVLLSAGLILVALRAAPPTFRVATLLAVGIVVGVVLACAVYLRRRWMDLQAAAWLVDRRAHLTDRLTTLIALQTRPRSSRFVPLLVKQTLALGTRWQPHQIQPRRVPRSAFLLLASLLALASTAFVSRHPPPPVAATAAQGPKAPDVGLKPVRPQKESAGPAKQDTAQMSGDAAKLALEDAEVEMQDGEVGAPGAGAGEHGGVSIATLPDRLQSAIRQAFRAQPLDRPRQLAGRSQPGSEKAGQGRDGTDGDDQDVHNRPDSRSDNPARGASHGPTDRQDQSASGKTGQQGGKVSSPTKPEPQHDGSSPGAGSESSPSGLMGPEGGESVSVTEGPKTFKLTITSFLRGMEQKGKPERQSGKHVATARMPAEGGGATALSERQLADDLLRKAEIPPAYEDIVRRVYSARASQ